MIPPNRWFILTVRKVMSENREELQEQVKKLKKLRADVGMNRTAFSEYIGIPLRNLEEWEAGRRKMPEYLLRMLHYYVKIDKYMEQKIEAMQFFESQVKKFPHPRSIQAIQALAKYRGSQMGMKNAESFKLIRKLQ